MSSRQLCAFFNANLSDGNFEWKKCGRPRKQALGTDYTNFLGHFGSKHPDYTAEFAGFQASSATTVGMFSFRSLPITEVENKSARAVVTMKPTTVGTLKQYIGRVVGKVGRAIATEMGVSFSLIFDGWKSHSIHFIGLYAVYMVDSERYQRLPAGLACVEKYPIMDEVLKPSAAIVHLLDFEGTVVKIQSDDLLYATEQRAVAGFMLPPTESHTHTAAAKDNFSATILRQVQKPRLSVRTSAQYDMLLHNAPPTSNTCERLFSGYKLVLTSLRSSTLPANFERVIFLRANCNLWNSATFPGYTEK
ncbi:hypothetical protein BBJ28_00016447 [Nothophytophthora sp. Chile5]|nr:hypothetical protein BBJ28_00016447 [Nothophytophthora sp. Chile5]